VLEIRGLSIPSAYAGGTNLENPVFDLPQRGFHKLLQLPSIVRYFEFTQTGSLMQKLFKSVFSIVYSKSPSLASSFVRLNLWIENSVLKSKFSKINNYITGRVLKIKINNNSTAKLIQEKYNFNTSLSDDNISPFFNDYITFLLFWSLSSDQSDLLSLIRIHFHQ
jgi:hypothetical protein